MNKGSFTFIDLFAGIGGFRLALEKNNGRCVFSSEWNKHSQVTYATNFGEIPHGDITKIKEEDIPKHNVLCAGFPCQAFSISGKRKGFEDIRGTLFFDIARIAKHHKPEVIFLENVKNFARHDEGKTLQVVIDTLDEIGYDTNIELLRSSDFGVPQARERVYIIAFRKELKINDFVFPKSLKKTAVVKDILEQDPVDKMFYIERSDIIFTRDENINDKRRPYQIGKISKGGQGERIYSPNASGITLSAFGGGAASKTGAYLVNGRVRKLTPRECARMQGFPDSFAIPANRNVAYRQFGDSVSVPVLNQIFIKVLDAYPELLKSKRPFNFEPVVINQSSLSLGLDNA